MLHDTVSKRKLESCEQVFIQLLYILHHHVTDRMLDLCLLKQIQQMLRCDLTCRLKITLKCVRPLVQLDRHCTVIYLISNRKCRIIIVRRADKPGSICDMYLSGIKLYRISIPCGRNKIQNPLILAWHFQNGQHLSKVILDTGKVHLVQDDHGRLLSVVRLIESSQEFRLIESLGELIKITEQLSTVTE